MDFETALGRLKRGGCVARGNWREVRAVRYSAVFSCCLALMREEGTMPWTPTHRDLMASDWFEVSSDQGDPVLERFLMGA